MDIQQFVLALGQQQPTGGGPAACGGSGSSSLLFMLLMFAVFWFILIRPQQKRAKEHAAMIAALKSGDQVITRGGVVGKVTGVQDNLVTLEVQEKVRIRVVKSYVEGKFGDVPQPAKTAAAKPAPTSSPDAKN